MNTENREVRSNIQSSPNPSEKENLSAQQDVKKKTSIVDIIIIIVLIPIVLGYEIVKLLIKIIHSITKWMYENINKHASVEYHGFVKFACYTAVIGLIALVGKNFLGKKGNSSREEIDELLYESGYYKGNSSSMEDEYSESNHSRRRKGELEKHPNEFGSDYLISTTGFYNPDGSINWAEESKYVRPASSSESSRSSRSSSHVRLSDIERAADREAKAYERAHSRGATRLDREYYESQKRHRQVLQDAYSGKFR